MEMKATESQQEYVEYVQDSLTAAQRLLTKAKATIGTHFIYLDRYGHVDMESTEASPEDASLPELAGTPSFEIVTVLPNGSVWSGYAGDHVTEPAELQNAVENAIAERTRFYTEREEVYGPDAWPKAG